MAKLKTDREKGKDARKLSIIYLEVPLDTVHAHSTNSAAVLLSNEVNPSISEKIYNLVSEGYSELRVVKMLLRKYVKEELFKDKEQKPSELDRSFYPLDRDITNHIRLAIARQKTSNIDQEELINRIAKWKAEDPNSSYFFRPYSLENNEHNHRVLIKDSMT